MSASKEWLERVLNRANEAGNANILRSWNLWVPCLREAIIDCALADLPATKDSRETRIAAFKEQQWSASIADYFLKRKDSLDRVVYSLLRHQNSELIWELYFRIQEGEATFTQLAEQHSQGQEQRTGGIIGPVDRGVAHPALAAVLGELKPGQLSPPRKIGEWYIILRLEQIMPAALDAETKARLIDERFDQWLNEQLALLSREGVA